MKWSNCCLCILGFLLTLSGTSQSAERFIFPVGIFVTEDLRRADEQWPFDTPAERLVDLRSKGVEMILLNGWYSGKNWAQIQGNIWFDSVMVDVATLREKLARADSFGFLVCADPKSIDETLKYWGHNPDVTPPYFRYLNYQQFTAQTFRDTLDSLVSWVMDSLNTYLQGNNVQSLYRYIFWDEPFIKHVVAVESTPDVWDDYWRNFWKHDDLDGWHTDSLGVGSLLKYEIERKDTLHSVWISETGDYYRWGRNPARGLCSLQVDTGGGVVPNPVHQMSLDYDPFVYDSAIGCTLALRHRWTLLVDSVVHQAKSLNPSNPPPTYVTQLQSWGCCNLDTTHVFRITIPEEVKELANLAVLHEAKGIQHYILWSRTEWGNYYACLWDSALVPFDAPYEEYVYVRNHSHFFDPETLRPFNPDDPIHDPFRTLPSPPTDTSSPRYLEDYYKWKYEPYARNYNALGEVNNQLHIIGTELLGLRKAPSVATIEADSGNIFLPEIVTLSPTTTSDLHLFYVNKDMKHSHMEFTVRIATGGLPPSLRSAYILDLSERHLIERTVDWWYITFRDTLGAGEGKLVRLMAGTELGDAMVADADIKFEIKGASGPSTEPQHVFTEGDSVKISATVYNLGFTALDTVVVKFYDGHRDSLNLMKADTISLAGLDVASTVPADSVASIIWSTTHDDIAPHNITVFVEEPLPSASNTRNNEANMALLVLPEDYATAVLDDPWDMAETGGGPGTADIDSFQGFLETPDSISGVWEAKTTSDSARVFLHLANTIDGSKYSQFSIRLIQDPGSSGQGYLKLGWKNQTGGAPYADSVLYDFGHWDVKNLDLSGHPGWKDSQILSLWLRPAPQKERLVKLSLMKLTTKKPSSTTP